ncbi:MAG: sigma-70 family RNA polymerase sigma factor [Candidatus Latescibacteria bacterium]|nr:sigma-70 family RNA polymerase sigma factor [bacterium]MBD3425401.1 sigma-70 family RNA polymerase sigma factor [Candidatus Latescibacterota bacterium]
MDPNDREIIEEVLSGNTGRFEILVERHRSMVFGIAARRVPAEDVDEMAHEIFIRAYRSLGGFRGESDFSHWLAGISVRACCDYWRKKYRSREMPMSRLSEKHRDWIKATLSDESTDSFTRKEQQEAAREILMAAMEKLAPKDRAVLELVHLEERTVREAASLLDWSTSNVKVRAHRARKKLRSLLEKMIETEGESYEFR